MGPSFLYLFIYLFISSSSFFVHESTYCPFDTLKSSVSIGAAASWDLPQRESAAKPFSGAFPECYVCIVTIITHLSLGRPALRDVSRSRVYGFSVSDVLGKV